MDLISRQAAIEAVEEPISARREWWSVDRARDEIKGLDAAMCEIQNLPTIDPVKHGRWDKDSIAFYWRCSKCGAIVKSNLWDVFLDPFSSHRNLNYCPNCGAQMEEVTE